MGATGWIEAMVGALVLMVASAQAQPPAETNAQTASREAQLAQQEPPLLFRETWRQPPHEGPLTDASRRVTQAAVGNPNLQLQLYGVDAHAIGVYMHEGRLDLWTGLASSPVAVTLRDPHHYFDLSAKARLRWIVRTNGLHVVHPVLKLLDGPLLVGSQAVSTEGEHLTEEGDYLENEVSFDDQHWYELDPVRVVTGREVRQPDLHRVSEIGFTDLMPGGGHGPAGWVNVSTMELYATARPR